MSSDSGVKIVTIGAITPHPNADTLSLTTVLDAYPVVVKTGAWQPGDQALYVPVDTLVGLQDTRYGFLRPGAAGTYRVRAARLRGIYSEGLLVPCVAGEDLASYEKYLPPSEREPTAAERGPGSRALKDYERSQLAWRTAFVAVCAGGILTAFGVGWAGLITLPLAYAWFRHRTRRVRIPAVQLYDIENLKRHSRAFVEGEHVVVVTEKIHGCHAAYYNDGKKLWCFSRTVMRANDGGNVWSQMAKKYNLDEVVPAGYVLRGEIYGPGIQDLTYGASEPEMMAFDLQNFKTREYLGYDAFLATVRAMGVPSAPLLYSGPYSESVHDLQNGKAWRGGHVREGIVIKPPHERTEHGLGRCVLKLVSEAYKLRKGAA